MLGFLRLEGLAVQGDRPVAMPRRCMQDYLPGRVGRVSVAGLDVLVPEAGGVLDRVRIGRIALEGVDLRSDAGRGGGRRRPPRPAAAIPRRWRG